MDEDATQLLLTALCKISDAELLEADTANGSWLLAFGGNSVALELGQRGASIRLIGEIGLEPSRIDEVLSNTELCRGMPHFNGDQERGQFSQERGQFSCYCIGRVNQF